MRPKNGGGGYTHGEPTGPQVVPVTPEPPTLADLGAAPPAATVRGTVRSTKPADRVPQLAGAFARRATDCTSGGRPIDVSR